ncbi:MAG TPA: hypothetical protein VF297_32425 [Pyrinomonadaceae bacterium]
MATAEENGDRLERVRRYNLDEHRDELRRVLAKIIGRRITGKVEVDLNQGAPGAMTSREVEKGTE